jgi:cytochrome c-type biogenesis protein CcmF
MIGNILVYVAFGGMVTATIAYTFAFFTGEEKYFRVARIGFHTGAVSVILTAGFFMNLILTHQLQYTYVWSYSSYALHPPLLISTFYVGQEGSFMLWTLYTSIIGLILMVYSRKHHYEASVMGIYSAIATFLVLLAIVKSPFEHVWQTWPHDVHAGFMPDDGRGLNPLLENLWIVIHPPILFLGFASTAVPFAHAFSGMLRKDYDRWINVAVPWTLFTSAILGFGITLGGFWAYETLGWGGFWGWDPVENSSFIPWLFAVASVHTLLVQRRTGGFKRANFLMGMMPFLLVLYSTFLTRSGVLGDTSVHSFEKPGMWVYIYLVILIAFFAVLGFGMYMIRVKEIPHHRINYSVTSREFALFLGAAALVVVAGFTLIGTSSPLITNILDGKPSAIASSYYIKTNLPLAIFMAAMIGLGQLFWWKKSNSQTLARTAMNPAIVATLLTVIVILAGMHDIWMVLFFLFSAFALFVNLQIAYKIARGNPRFIGASLAHVGIAILFMGIIASTRYDRHVTLSLPPNTPEKAFGYDLTYIGPSQTSGGRTAYDVVVGNGSSSFIAPLVMYASSYNDGAIMRTPYIFSLVNYDAFTHPALLAFIGRNMLTRDLYLSPQSLEDDSAGEGEMSQSPQSGIPIRLSLGEPVNVGKYTFTFKGFNVPEDQKTAMMSGEAFELTSLVEIKTPGGTAQVLDLTNKVNPGGQNENTSLKIKSGDQFTVTQIHVNDKTKETGVMLNYLPAKNSSDASLTSNPQFHTQGGGERLVIEATIKPFINLVWGGVIIMVIGFIVTWRRRRADLAGMSE